MEKYKPKVLKNLKVKHNKKTYDKIVYLSCSDGYVHFENLDSDSVTTNINCKLEDVEISILKN